MIPPSSPSLLTPPSRPPGVRRLNRVPIAIGCIAFTAVIFAVGYTAVKRSEQNQAQEAQTKDAEAKKTQGGKTPGFLDATANRSVPPAPIKTVPDATPPSAAPRNTNSGLTIDEQARAQAWTAYYAAQAQLVATHNSMEQAAHSGLMDPLQSAGGGNQPSPGDASLSPPGVTPPNGTTANGLPYSMGGVDPNGQTGKQAFLNTPGDLFGQDENLKGSVHGPKPSTIMEGTALPCRLLEGATSDMPGQLNAEIVQNVYDSMTGDLLLVPQGTRLVTTYDIAVSAGQERMGVIGQRLIFPDTSSRQLGSMSMADQTGLAGLKDLRDTHFWEKFGAALTVSLIGAGAQLSQPQQSAFAAPSSTSAATGAMTQQLSQFGQTQAQRGLSIPDTIELRPGLLCMLKLNKDVTLPVWHDARLSGPGGGVSMTVGRFFQ